MTNNNHQNKSKRIQCKDVSTLTLLRFVASWTDEFSSVTLFKLDDEPRSVWQIMLPVIPMCVMKQKFENMVRKGLINGCYCGCRGDFTITPKGRQRIALLEATQARRANEYLNRFYDQAGVAPGTIVTRQVAAVVSREIEELISKGQLTAIDALLKHVKFEKLSVPMAISLIRTTFRLKDRLENWQPALLRFDLQLQANYPRRRDSLMAGLQQLLPTIMPDNKEPNWAGDPHQEWKTRVADENRLILVDAQSNVIMRADSEATVAEWWLRNTTLAQQTHVRVYREIDLTKYMKAEVAAKEKKEKVAKQRAEEKRREEAAKYREDWDIEDRY